MRNKAATKLLYQGLEKLFQRKDDFPYRSKGNCIFCKKQAEAEVVPSSSLVEVVVEVEIEVGVAI